MQKLNCNEILVEQNSAMLNICQNIVGNIMQLVICTSSSEKIKVIVSFLHLEGVQGMQQSRKNEEVEGVFM